MKKNLLAIAMAIGTCSIAIASADADVEIRLNSLNCIIPNASDPAALKIIHRLLACKQETEKLIGKTATYFPLFDQELKKYHLPEELKNITLLESELNNREVSGSGATGVWQLMADVHSEFGLRIDKALDERYDMLRSSEAALKDLKRMYEAYGDWNLALAGYNCGVGRLAEAIKRARSKNFEQVKNFLPEQTRAYIPKFVAYTYIMRNYRRHGLHPRLPNIDLQVIGAVKVFSYTTLQQAADVTGVPLTIIKDLNPQYGEGFVPDDKNGHNIFLPRRCAPALEEYLSHPDVKGSTALRFSPIIITEGVPALKEDPNYFMSVYTCAEGETLETLAPLFQCEAYNLALWNHLDPSAPLTAGQELTIYMPRVAPKKA